MQEDPNEPIANVLQHRQYTSRTKKDNQELKRQKDVHLLVFSKSFGLSPYDTK